mmetsp:Transcript_100478/g.322396  ORF Transcript_100478/g.322396 Transcript_100478/m.322396 type:complete len:665 (-) Transcript_100478:258-2252(-)
MAPNLYRVLGIEFRASTQDVRAAFKRSALEVHPDKGGCKEAFQLVLLAFETLSDVAARAKHDRLLAGHASSTGQVDRPPASRARAPPPAKRQHTQPSRPSCNQPQPSTEPPIEPQRKQKRPTAEREPPPIAPAKPVSPFRRPPHPPPAQSSPPKPTTVPQIVAPGPCASAPVRSLGGRAREPGLTQYGANRAVAEDILLNIFLLLQMLSQEVRVTVIRDKLCQPLRLALETRIVELKQAASSHDKCPLVRLASWTSTSELEDGDALVDINVHSPIMQSRSLSPMALEDKASHESVFSDKSSDRGTEQSDVGECDGHDLSGQAGSLDGDDGHDHEIEHLEDDWEQGTAGTSDAFPRVHSGDGMPDGLSNVAPVSLRKGQASSRPGGMEGIARRVVGESTIIRYEAFVELEGLKICCRYVRDLPAALEFLVVLTTVKVNFKSTHTAGSFAYRLRQVVLAAFMEHSTCSRDLGLRFRSRFRVPMLGTSIWTPWCHDLDAALKIHEGCMPFRPPRRQVSWRARWPVLRDFDAKWADFRLFFAMLLENVLGKNIEDVSAGLERIRSQTERFREAYWERCERLAMSEAEKACHAGGTKHRKLSNQERQELRERSAMRKQEKLMRRFLKLERKAEHTNRRFRWPVLEPNLSNRASVAPVADDRGSTRAGVS